MVGKILSTPSGRARQHSSAEVRRPDPGAHKLERVLDVGYQYHCIRHGRVTLMAGRDADSNLSMTLCGMLQIRFERPHDS